MDNLFLFMFFIGISTGQEVTKTTTGCVTDTPEPTMRTVDKLKDAYDEFKKSYCEGNSFHLVRALIAALFSYFHTTSVEAIGQV